MKAKDILPKKKVTPTPPLLPAHNDIQTDRQTDSI